MPMTKSLRIWIAGELLVDESVREDMMDFAAFAGPHREVVVLAAKHLLPWRVELGDRDADVREPYSLAGPQAPP